MTTVGFGGDETAPRRCGPTLFVRLFVFELGFGESILPLMGELRSVLNDKQIVLVTHPESGILASRR